ncbi:MAG: glycosyl hydrolase family 18 protein [Planctomycetota bacterium]|nr:glycosyl hydrolase family 18 protein [Planctomycetota bacterium]
MTRFQDIVRELLKDKSKKSPYKRGANLNIESLENRSLLAAHPLADAPDVNFNVAEQWESGHTADLTITNDEGTAFSNWQLEFDYDGAVSSFWNANVASDGNGHYTVTPPTWDSTLDPGESLGVGIVADGQPGDLRNVTFNGVAEQGGGSQTPDSAPQNPVNLPNDNGSADPTNPGDSVAPVAGSPSTPSLSVLTNWETGGYDVSVNLWSGDPAESWKVYENGELIHEADFESTDATPQSAKVNISDNTYGVYTYQVEVSNAAGTTASTQVTHVVGGASQIEILSEDAQSQALQLTIQQGSNDYDLSIGDSQSATFSVATNNSRVVSVEMIDADTLRVTGLEAGRASVKITDADTGETRYLGFRVRTAEGELPGLPDYLTIGSVSEDSAGDLAFWQDFDGTDPATNKFVDSRYIYLNGGPVNGWRTWGDRVGSYVRESLKLGMIPQFVYYNIPDGGESFTTNNEHLASTEYMEGYFNDLKFALDTIASEAGDELVQFIMEPDFIGYLMQNANAPASALPAMTSAAYSSGVLQQGVDPQFDNTVTGLINAINYTISSHQANVEFGWQFNLWASPGIETPIGSQGICHLTDTMGIEAGRAAIAREAELIAEYYMDAGVLSYGAEFISIDKYGLDAGAQNGAAADPAASTWFWNADHWNNYLLVVETLSETTGKEMILWQIPVGHINDSLATNPYDESGTFEALDNTTRQYEDSAPTYFLGDTFTATGDRYDHFAANESGDAKITSDGNTITWESHMEEAKAAGVRQILFGAGVGISTDSIGTEPTDDYWWISKVQQYYQDPVEMEGTIVTPPAEVIDAPADPISPPVEIITPPVENIDPPASPITPPAENIDPPAEAPVATATIIENSDVGFSQTGFSYLSNAQVADAVAGDVYMLRGGSGIATWNFNNLPAGEYQIATTWSGRYDNKYNATDAPYTVRDGSGNVLADIVVDQTGTPSDFEDAGVSWTVLATVTASDGTISVSLAEGSNANRYVVADAVRLVKVSTDSEVEDSPATPVAPPAENIDVPAENVTPPVETIDPPADPVAPPVEEATPPVAEEVVPPSESVDPPADPVVPPAGEIAAPVEEIDSETPPAESVTPPAENIDPPAEIVTPPAETVDTPAEDTAPPATNEDPEADPISQPVVAAYYPEWGIYGRDYQIADVPAEDLTHFIYAFANLTAGGEMVLFDSYAATEKRFSAEDSVSGEADLWSYPADDPRSQQTVWGNFNQLSQLKEKYPHLRTSIALGGWTLSGNFSSVCSTAAGRETLAQSIYDFLDTYTVFDGIDFDWEYPGGGGLSSNGVSDQDGENYALLLGLVRDKLDQLGTENGRYYEITVASPAGYDKIANFNLEGMKEHVDFFNVMTYDFHGTWENTTGHQAALMGDANGYDIATAIDIYLNAGVEREQIVLGAPAYTRAWSGVADGGDNGYNEATSGAAPGSFEKGTYDYKDLAGQYLSGTGDWELNWDDDAQAAYMYSESQGIFSSFETPGSISLKSEWAQDLGLGGMMFWDASNDAAGQESLIGAAADSWLAGKSFNEITSASDLVFENIYGGNGLFDAIVEADTTPSLPQVPVNNGNGNGSAGTDLPAAPAPVEPIAPPVETIEQPVSDPVPAPVTPVENPLENQIDSAAVSYSVASSWNSGLTANMAIQNTGDEAITEWTLEFTYSGDIQSIWDAEIVSRDGDRYVITGLSWNSNIAAGAQLSFGFTAAGSAGDGPSDVLFNGKSINV